VLLAALNRVHWQYRIRKFSEEMAMTFQFWRKWLIVVTGVMIIFGFDLVVLTKPLIGIFNTLYFPNIDATQALSSDANQIITFLYGVLGAVMVGWGCTILMMVLGWFREGERGAWNSIAVSLLIWFVIDSSFSIYAGAPANAVFNLVFLVLFAVPLVATSPYRATNASNVRAPSV
jgi:hypothetical protein